MRILVVGGTKFIGRAIVSRLVRDGHEITLLNRGLSADPFGTAVRRVLGDRRNHETIRRATERDHDVVIDVTAYHEQETATAIDAFRDRTGHFIHISTAAVYLIRDRALAPFREQHFSGKLTSPKAKDESAWQYAHHKRRCEEALCEAWDEHRFPFSSLRLPMVVGPHDYTRRADAYLERLITSGPLLLPEGGLNSWGFLWVDDVAEVIASNLGNRKAFGKAYNLAQKEALSLRQMVDLAAARLQRTARVLSMPTAWLDAVGIGTSFSPYSHDRDVLLDCTRAEEDLLFEPTPVETWIDELVGDFESRWDGTTKAFANTRSFELALAQELTKVRLPTYPIKEAESPAGEAATS